MIRDKVEENKVVSMLFLGFPVRAMQVRVTQDRKKEIGFVYFCLEIESHIAQVCLKFTM